MLQIFTSQNLQLLQWGEGIVYTGDLLRYVLDRFSDNLTDKLIKY